MNPNNQHHSVAHKCCGTDLGLAASLILCKRKGSVAEEVPWNQGVLLVQGASWEAGGAGYHIPQRFSISTLEDIFCHLARWLRSQRERIEIVW